jgi:hypothetical protein
VAAVGLAVLGLAAWASVAVAQEPPPASPACAVVPDDYTGVDRIRDELRDVRIDAVKTCVVLEDRLGTLASRSSAANGKLDALVASGELTAAAVAVLRDLATGDGLAVTQPESGPVAGTQPVTLADEDRQWLADTGTAMRADQWFLIGLVSSLLFGFLLIRHYT